VATAATAATACSALSTGHTAAAWNNEPFSSTVGTTVGTTVDKKEKKEEWIPHTMWSGFLRLVVHKPFFYKRQYYACLCAPPSRTAL
jgi:hypothetical protein